MGKIYNQYLKLKAKSRNTLYLFQTGIFYIFIADDAIVASKELNLKLSAFNNDYLKCGFPIKSLEKYVSILNTKKINYSIATPDDLNNSDLSINDSTTTIIQIIKNLEINSTSPVQALNILHKLKLML